MSAKFSKFGAIYSELRNYSRLYVVWDIYGLSDEEFEEFELSAKALDFYCDTYPEFYFVALKVSSDALISDKYSSGLWIERLRGKNDALLLKANEVFNPIPF